MSVCMYVFKYVYLYIDLYVCTYVYTYVCMYVCMYICMYICMYVLYDFMNIFKCFHNSRTIRINVFIIIDISHLIALLLVRCLHPKKIVLPWKP